MAGTILQKYAVSRRVVFDNCCPQADAFEILLPQLGLRHLQKIRDELNFRPGDPYIARTRAGATPAALHTLEVQPTDIPPSFRSCQTHYLVI
jgi:hypothetical protein